MKVGEVLSLIRVRGPEPNRIRRVLRAAPDISALRQQARRRLPRAVFDYVDGGADDEITLAANRQAFTRCWFTPIALTDVSAADVGTTLLGARQPVPLGLAPTGYTRMVHPAGEVAVARAAGAAGIPYVLSTVGTSSIEEVAAVGHERRWFQLYLLRDRGLTLALIDRAAAAGYEALEVSVDTAVSGYRSRDVRNGLTIPPSLTAGTVLDIGTHVSYWLSMVTSPAFRFANLVAGSGATIESITDLFDSSATWDDLAEIRSRWPGKLLVKGPIGPGDARRAIDAGADGVHLSNHGGRQLDRCVPAIDLVNPVRAAIGDKPTVIVDSGVRHGADIALAIAKGADAAFIGRSYLYGLAVAGQAGVAQVIAMLSTQFLRTIQLLGVTSVAELRSRGDDLLVGGRRLWTQASDRGGY